MDSIEAQRHGIDAEITLLQIGFDGRPTQRGKITNKHFTIRLFHHPCLQPPFIKPEEGAAPNLRKPPGLAQHLLLGDVDLQSLFLEL